MIYAKPLCVEDMNLCGQHIIEASAGTGKTYNITKIFIRLLLTKDLSIQEILVVTFTKAATQEMRGRIAQSIHELLAALTAPQNNKPVDPFYEHCLAESHLSRAKAIDKLRLSALELDEAAIYTINSFCQQILTQSAFLRASNLNLTLVNSSRPFVEQAVQDWFRTVQYDEDMMADLLALDCATPSSFIGKFSEALYGTTQASVIDLNKLTSMRQAVYQDWLDSQQQAITDFKAVFARNTQGFNAALDNRKGLKYTLFLQAYTQLAKWLSTLHIDDLPSLEDKNFDSQLFNKTTLKTCLKQDPLGQQAALDIFVEFGKSTLVALRETLFKYEQSIQQYPLMQQIFAACQAIRQQVDQQKAQAGVIDHNDTITQLAATIKSGNQVLIDYITKTYPVALIDEFQDTDAHQYQIFSTCYSPDSEHTLLLMIGDPKQAIYGFRGGDINTYLAAKHAVPQQNHWSMQHNYRSSEAMIDAYNVLFYGANIRQTSLAEIKANLPLALQDQTQAQKNAPNKPIEYQHVLRQGIDYPWIYRGNNGKEPHFYDPDFRGALCFQVNQEAQSDDLSGDVKHHWRSDFKAEQAHAVALEIKRLLQCAKINGNQVKPEDIAILARSSNEIDMVRQALQAEQIASVCLSEKASVYASTQAANLLMLLDGIMHHQNERKFVRAISTDLFGLSAQQLYDAQINEQLLDELKRDCIAYKQLWTKSGALTLVSELLKKRFTYRQSSVSHERVVTNYLHLAELLHLQSRQLGQHAQLITWFKRQIDNLNGTRSDHDDDIQRLESDDKLVKIITLHGSKGLQYPIVFIPFAGYQSTDKDKDAVLVKCYDQIAKRNVLQFGSEPEKETWRAEQQRAEELRLLYVGISRAECRCYLGIGRYRAYAQSTLSDLLSFQGVDSSDAQAVFSNIPALADCAPNLYGYQAFGLNIRPSVSEGSSAHANLPTHIQWQPFNRSTDSQWQLYSYSRLTKQAKHVDLSTKPSDESNNSASKNSSVDTSLAYRFSLNSSADTGSMLHDLLEHHDFTQPIQLSSDNQIITNYAPAVGSVDTNLLSDWLNEILNTPIQDTHSQQTFALKDLSVSETLREPNFYFPVERLNAENINALLKVHRNCDSIDIGSASIQGMMHGFIDLIFCYQGRYCVADYKSNRLGNTAEDYTFDNMRRSIEEKSYDLQYLIYAWALDRFLSNRIQNYSREQHFGGVYYLYLRGMSPSFPKNSGVYTKTLSEQDWQALETCFKLKESE